MMRELKTIVCIKSVIRGLSGTTIVRTPELSQLNPFDRPALELALALRETHGGQVTALTMGPEDTGAYVLAEARALGVDQGVLVSDYALSGSDTLATSTALGAALHKLAPFDLVLFGARSSDSDTGQVGPQTATLLDLPLVTMARTIEPGQSGLEVERTCDELVERFEVDLPAVLTVSPAAGEGRDIPLMGMARAFAEKGLTTFDLEALGLSPDQVGQAGSGTRVLALRQVKRSRSCEFLEGPAEKQAEALVARLRDLGLVG